ncbi:MAG: DUF3857 domain-containing protein [Bacteroidota bacterium]
MKQPQLLLVVFTLFFSGILSSFAQSEFGVYSAEEKNMTVYEKDTTAAAVYLFDTSDTKFEVKDSRVVMRQTVHARVKVLKKEEINQSTVEILFYHNDGTSEKIEDLQALTFLNGKKHYVADKDMFTTDHSENRKELKFTFPEVQPGAILEYKYTKISPWVQYLDDWFFQSDIPVVYSEYHAEIPGNYTFNKALIGNLPLDVNDATIKKRCFYLPNSSDGADCENVTFAMKDIPAFEYDEQYMLSPYNYLARLDFEISEYRGFSGKVTTYTKTWKSVDSQFKKDKDIGGQLTKKGFFEKNVPDSLFEESDPLAKAKGIFDFVKNHYTWNGKHGRYGKARVKQAFNNRKGTAAEINMSLINLLNAADIKTNMMLLSTRFNGLAKKTYPVMKDFNYLVAFTEIGGKKYFLDATDKFMAFGRIPYKCLNHYGRVMDFSEASYWENIVPLPGNKIIYRTNLNYDEDLGVFAGTMDQIRMGYDGLRRRKALKDLDNDTDKILDVLDTNYGDIFEIDEYSFLEKQSSSERTYERFSFATEMDLENEVLFFNPFLIQFFASNPLGLEERTFPVDFGHSRNWKFDLNITIPQGYEIEQMPENQEVQLGNGLGYMKIMSIAQGSRAKITYELNLKNPYFPTNMYQPLREFFGYAVDQQKNASLTIRKSESK